MSENLKIWDALAKTDPKHTKQFKRSGGFSGTAIKPIWITKMLTEQFGPVGSGWGVDEPSFQVVPGENREVLVYCTVACWHTDRANRFFGVGGDKVVSYLKADQSKNRPERWDSDDEAFKKAYTDAIGNAFKLLGVGADVHMGLFDDMKYRDEMAREFAEQPAAPTPAFITDDQRDIIAGLAPAAGLTLQEICDGYKTDSLKALPASKFAKLRERLDGLIAEKTGGQKAAA